MEFFQDLNLSPLLVKAISEMGFEKPTPIQEQTLPILLGEPTDFMGLAATGTGKTVAFSIPLLEKLDPKIRAVQALILCPTRELALQIAGQIDLLGKHLGVRALTIYGGSSYGDQIRGLKNGAKIVVGTPGRIVDHMEKGTLDLSHLTTVVLDEADEMISMGFKEDLEKILSNAPKEQCQTWFFCATMSGDVRKVANEYLNQPQQVQVNRAEMVPQAIDQIYYKVHESDKPEIVCKLIDHADDFYGIIFCQTKALVTDLTLYLKGRDYRVDCLHGDMDQNARERTMKSFRERRVTVLVCTDVASRGLDVKDITHVINYSIPRELDNYVHRIGRTARSGKTGFAMNLVTPSHRGLVTRIEHVTKSKMREGRLPTRKEIGAKMISGVLPKFQAQETFSRVIELLDASWKTAIEGMSPEEIVGRFLSLNFQEIFTDRVKPEAIRQERAPVRAEHSGRSAERPAGRPTGRPQRGPHGSGGYDRPAPWQRPREDRRPLAGPAPMIRPPAPIAAAPKTAPSAPVAPTIVKKPGIPAPQPLFPKKKIWKHAEKKFGAKKFGQNGDQPHRFESKKKTGYPKPAGKIPGKAPWQA